MKNKLTLNKLPIGNLLKLFLFAAMLISSVASYAQCNNPFAFGSGTAPTSVGVTVTLTTCAFYGEYSTINSVQAATNYSCNVTPASPVGYLTVRQGTPGGPVIAHGTAPLTWSSTVAGTYYLHYNANAACGTDGACHTGTINYIGPASVDDQVKGAGPCAMTGPPGVP